MINAPADTGWHNVGASGEPAFQNSWANSGAPYPSTRFRKTREDVVHVQVAVSSGVAAAVFTLPAGYRPSANLYFTGFWGANNFLLLVVSSAGVVSTVGAPASPVVCNFSFPVDA